MVDNSETKRTVDRFVVIIIVLIIVLTAIFIAIRGFVIQSISERQVAELELATDNAAILIMDELKQARSNERYPDLDSLTEQIRRETFIKGMEFYLINESGDTVISTIRDMEGRPAPVGSFRPVGEKGVLELDMLDTSSMQPVRYVAAYQQLDSMDVTCLVYALPAYKFHFIAQSRLLISIITFDIALITLILMMAKIRMNEQTKPNPYEYALHHDDPSTNIAEDDESI